MNGTQYLQHKVWRNTITEALNANLDTAFMGDWPKPTIRTRRRTRRGVAS